jgi:hypothetical protein
LQWTIGLPPGSFGIVMASGIISVAAHDQRRDGVSAALAITAAVVWMGLLVLTAARVVLAADLVRDDLQSPAKRFDFFTLVAAAGVLGVRAAIARWGRISVALSLFGALAWLVVALSMAMHRRSATLELTRFPGRPESWRQGRPREVRDGRHLPSRVPP